MTRDMVLLVESRRIRDGCRGEDSRVRTSWWRARCATERACRTFARLGEGLIQGREFEPCARRRYPGRMPRIVLPTSEIRNEKTFHAVCQRVFGFPDFYAHTMDAWVDCLSCLDDPAADMSSFTLAAGELLVIVVPGSTNLKDDSSAR